MAEPPTPSPRPGRESVADEARRSELAAYLKARRAALTPAAAGLSGAGRRRVPGLRRHEVADLAGISDTWYTWLEQGRDIRLSSDAVTALARALGLEGESARHLRRLAGLGLDSVDTPTTFDPVLLELLTQWEPTPAYIANGRLDLLACNRAYRAV
ncbi:MAG: helix-turn-helix domain-containing protein, partial [Acidimicrobiia bacterium]